MASQDPQLESNYGRSVNVFKPYSAAGCVFLGGSIFASRASTLHVSRLTECQSTDSSGDTGRIDFHSSKETTSKNSPKELVVIS